MSDRTTRIEAFLTHAGWAEASRVALAGDMSARRYTRLTKPDGKRAILMDDPPGPKASTPAFVAITGLLHGLGCSAPEIFHADTSLGLLILEDLGDDLFTSLISESPSRQRHLYEATLPLLVTLRSAPTDGLPRPSATDMIAATRVIDDALPPTNLPDLDRFRAGLETVLTRALHHPATLSLRDFHAANLLWLPARDGIARIGLLDYQDAFLSHPIYDLVSLLTDARTEVSPDLRADILTQYIDATGDNAEDTREAFAALSAQRNLRILGLFARTPAKKDLMPRVWRYLSEAVDHPALVGLRQYLDSSLPLAST